MAHIIGPNANRQRIVFVFEARDVGVTSGNPFEANTLGFMALSRKVFQQLWGAACNGPLVTFD